jgi:hypothetical protein
MRLWSVVLLCLLSGCYQPDFSDLRYRCDGQSPACPAGFTCIRGVCQRPDEAQGCLSRQGIRVGDSAYACPGTFAAGKAQGLCAPGYSLCVDGRGISPAACGTRGFFASRTRAHRRPSMRPEEAGCGGPDRFGDQLLLVGCGSLADSTSVLSTPCGGLTAVLDCATDSRWSCNGGLEQAENRTHPDSGVLCCR